MFLMKVALSHLIGMTEIVVIALDLPEPPDVIVYEGKEYHFEKYLNKSGRPLYREIE